MKQFAIVLLLVVAVCVPFALAQDAPEADAQPAAKDDTPQLAAARRLGKAIGMDKQIDMGLAAMQPMIHQLAMQLQLDPAAAQELHGIFRAWFVEDCDFSSVNEKVLGMYAEKFTAAELNELSDFYETDLGKKLLREQPDIMQYSTQLGMEEGQRKQGALMQRLQPFIMKYQQQMQQGAMQQGPPMQPGAGGGHGPNDGHNH